MGEVGWYEESDLTDASEDALLPPEAIAGGGRVKDIWLVGIRTSSLPRISVEDTGVGGSPGRGMPAGQGETTSKGFWSRALRRERNVALVLRDQPQVTMGGCNAIMKSSNFGREEIARYCDFEREGKQRFNRMKGIHVDCHR